MLVNPCRLGQAVGEAEAGGPIFAALSAGEGNYAVPSKEACEYAHSQFMAAGNLFEGGKDWAACLRLADRLDPTYKD